MTVLGVYASPCFILTTSLWGGASYPHLINVDAETQRDKVTCPQSPSQYVMKLGFKTRFDSQRTSQVVSPHPALPEILSITVHCPEGIVGLQALYELTPAHISSLTILTPWAPATTSHEAFQEWPCSPRHGNFAALLFWLVYVPFPFLYLANSCSSFKIQLKYPLLWKFLWLPDKAVGGPWPRMPVALCTYLHHGKQLSGLFLSDIPLATIPHLRIHCRQIICAASPPASRCHFLSVENTHTVFPTRKSGNCFKTKSFLGGINHQVSCGSIHSAIWSVWWLFWSCTRHYIHL